MSVIQGKAKKYSDEAIDYVLIFDWATGNCLGKAIPDAAGVWTYEYFEDLLCGITYVADGCEPITHGAYSFKATVHSVFGFLLSSYSSAGSTYDASLDKTATSAPTWFNYFSKVLNVGLHDYSHGSSTTSTTLKTKVIEMFRFDWELELVGTNGSYIDDTHKWTFEILDANNVVLAAIKSERDGDFRSGLWYGLSLTALTKAGQTGSYPATRGNLSFTPSGINYINTGTSNMNHAFNLAVDLTSATKVRVSGSSKSVSAGTAGGSIRILPEIAQQ